MTQLVSHNLAKKADARCFGGGDMFSNALERWAWTQRRRELQRWERGLPLYMVYLQCHAQVTDTRGAQTEVLREESTCRLAVGKRACPLPPMGGNAEDPSGGPATTAGAVRLGTHLTWTVGCS